MKIILLLNGSKIGDLLIISVNLLRVLFFLVKLDGPGLLRLLEDEIELASSASDEALALDLNFLAAAFSFIAVSSPITISSFNDLKILGMLKN